MELKDVAYISETSLHAIMVSHQEQMEFIFGHLKLIAANMGIDTPQTLRGSFENCVKIIDLIDRRTWKKAYNDHMADQPPY